MARDTSTHRVTIRDLHRMKEERRRIAMATAYTFSQARLVDQAGIDVILVGDSVSNTELGHETTLPVTVDQMLYHTAAVARGRERAFLVGDMPFLSYQIDAPRAVENAGRFLKEAGADAVKLEGGDGILDTVRAITRATIPVMGHLGLTPQSVSMLSGYRVQGRDHGGARAIIDQALRLEDAGIFALVLECVPHEVARRVSERLAVPTIGIGAGPSTDGQVLVLHDLLGLSPEGFRPRFVKRYAELGKEAVGALERFRDEVRSGAFPGPEHAFDMPPDELKKLAETDEGPYAGAGPFDFPYAGAGPGTGAGATAPPAPAPAPHPPPRS